MRALLPFQAGFLDELEKISAVLSKESAKHVKENRKAWSFPQTRGGKRPLRVDTLLRKEKDGTLGGYKFAEVLRGLAKIAHSTGPMVPFIDGVEPASAKRVPKAGDVPSRDDFEGNTPRREDGRGNAHTDYPIGTHLHDVGAIQQPQERSS